MSKVTSKLQVTIPKAVASQYGVSAGTVIEFEPAGDSIRIRIPERSPVPPPADAVAWRLQRFQASVARQRARDAAPRVAPSGGRTVSHRGWTREELYDDGVPS